MLEKKLPIVWKGILFDSDEEMFFAMWLEELKEVGYVRQWKRAVDSISLTDGLKISYIKVTKLKTKTKHEEKEFTVLRPSEYTTDFDVTFTPEGIMRLVNYITPAGSFEITRPFFSNERLRGLFEIKPGFDQNNMERLFKNNQKFIWDKYKIFVNLVEPIELFKKTFLPSEAAPYFKYKVVPKKAKAKGKVKGDFKFDWKPKTIKEFLNDTINTKETV
jgi:hypothetical protein